MRAEDTGGQTRFASSPWIEPLLEPVVLERPGHRRRRWDLGEATRDIERACLDEIGARVEEEPGQPAGSRVGLGAGEERAGSAPAPEPRAHVQTLDLPGRMHAQAARRLAVGAQDEEGGQARARVL